MSKGVTPDLVPCYGCGTRERRMEPFGFLLGCLLCAEYGDGHGKMRRDMRHKSARVWGKLYEPPPYECFECEDAKTMRIGYCRPAFGIFVCIALVAPCNMCCGTVPTKILTEMDALLAAEGVAVWTRPATEVERLTNLEVCDRVIANHPTIRK